MTQTSGLEQVWRSFPELRQAVEHATLPASLYHHGGVRSPYTTVLDDLRDMTQAANLVAVSSDALMRCATRLPEESPEAHSRRLILLMDELGGLNRLLEAMADQFIHEPNRQIQAIQSKIGREMGTADRNTRP